jgi:mannan endo-1,4-beta-mannosidase
MKTILFFFSFLIVLSTQVQSQTTQTIHTSGKYILGPCQDTLLLRGVNYAPYNWGWSPTELLIPQIALSGANTVRLVWYKTGSSGTPASTYANLVLLDSALSKCIQHKLIPVLELHDQTCANSPTALNTLATWFTQTAVLNLIQKYKHSLILNIANEALYVLWMGNTQAVKNTFINTYSNIVNTLRSNNIQVPLMIDAPDCGQHLDFLADAAPALLAADPSHNLIFSAHAYWYSYASNDSVQMLNKINYALSKNVAIVLGEIANQQDNTTNCQYNLNYQALLNICQQKKVGWYAWGWNNDVCPQRCMSSNGQFSNLTAYGNNLVYHAQYGLLPQSPAKSHYLLHGNCSTKVNLQLYLQGYLMANNLMQKVLYQQGIETNINSTHTDTVLVSLHQAQSPFNLSFQTKALLHQNGTCLAWFPESSWGNSYFIRIKHRNHCATWSSVPIQMQLFNTYDFSNQILKAYGNNQYMIDPTHFAFYTGDINQDEVIDGLDYNDWEDDSNQFAGGYFSSDLNGDGIVDGLDFIYWEQNSNEFIGVVQP